jgi:hypothetical protein
MKNVLPNFGNPQKSFLFFMRSENEGKILLRSFFETMKKNKFIDDENL